MPAAETKLAGPGVRVAILGPPEIYAEGRHARGLRSLTQQLIVYLSLHRRGAIADELAEALLPGVALDRARRRISRALSEARSELGDVIVRSGDVYALDPTAVAIDVDEFDFLLAQAKAEHGPTRGRLFERALALVRGEPLAGTDYPWAAGDERHLNAEVVDVLQQLGELRLADGDPAEALAAAERALRFDEDNESAQRLAMRAESALGLRETVVKRYERLADDSVGGSGSNPSTRRALSTGASSARTEGASRSQSAVEHLAEPRRWSAAHRINWITVEQMI